MAKVIAWNVWDKPQLRIIKELKHQTPEVYKHVGSVYNVATDNSIEPLDTQIRVLLEDPIYFSLAKELKKDA